MDVGSYTLLIIGFIVLAIAIGLVRDREIHLAKGWLAIPVAILLLSIILGSIVIVPAGERGVHKRFGDTVGSFNEGLSFKIPYLDSFENMSVKTQVHEVSATAASLDLQDVQTTIALNYKVDPSRVENIYKTIGTDYIGVIANPVIQEVVKQVTARYNAEEMILKRSEVKNEMTTAITDRLAERGIIAEQVSITNFQFSAVFTASIEAKVAAQQNILTAKNDLERVKVEAEQALAKAEGEKNARIAKAEGEAEAIRIVTEAQKNANEDIASSLNEEILQYIFLDRLGDDIDVIVPNGMTLTLPSN